MRMPPRRALSDFAAAIMLGGAFAATAAEPVPAAEPAHSAADVEEILVTGERPGPGMWRVAKGNHVLWILATLEPLPKELTWRSRTVEARIAESQAILAPPEVEFEVGFFRGLTLMPSLLRARRNPDGKTLEEILPHDQYLRWLALRVKYLGRWSGRDQVRPMVAARELYTHALDASGLTEEPRVWDSVKEGARRHRVAIQSITLKVPLEQPRETIRQLGEISRDAELDCLDTTMRRLEADLQGMRQRANLWSLGDIQGLRALPYSDQEAACLNAVSSVPQLRERVRDLEQRLAQTWLAAVDHALEQDSSSIAVVPITLLLGADGYLERLRGRGYRLDEP